MSAKGVACVEIEIPVALDHDSDLALIIYNALIDDGFGPRETVNWSALYDPYAILVTSALGVVA